MPPAPPPPRCPRATTTPATPTTPADAAEVAAIPPARDRIRGPVATIDVRVAIEIVVDVDVDVVTSPPAAPSPAAAPERTHHHAYSEGNRHSSGVVAPSGIVERVVRVDGRAVHHHRIVGRHIHHFWICLLDYDHLFALDDFSLNLLLFGRLQTSLVLSFLAHALHGVHHIALLREEGIPEIRGPLNIIGQSVDNIWQGSHRLDAGVPRLLGDRIGEG